MPPISSTAKIATVRAECDRQPALALCALAVPMGMAGVPVMVR